MKTITYSNSEILFDAGLNSLNLSNREDAESGYENCLGDIENFFRIEELTLYATDQNKQIDQFKSQIK